MRKLYKIYSRVTKESTDVRQQAYDSLSCLKEASVNDFKEKDIEVHHVSLPEKQMQTIKSVDNRTTEKSEAEPVTMR